MLNQVSHEHKDDVLHIKVTGALHHADHLPIWNQIAELAHQYISAGILLECCLKADRISMAHCFEMIDRFPMLCRLLDCRIAICGREAGVEAIELLKFVETASRDRGASVRIFDAADAARLWLKTPKM